MKKSIWECCFIPILHLSYKNEREIRKKNFRTTNGSSPSSSHPLCISWSNFSQISNLKNLAFSDSDRFVLTKMLIFIYLCSRSQLFKQRLSLVWLDDLGTAKDLFPHPWWKIQKGGQNVLEGNILVHFGSSLSTLWLQQPHSLPHLPFIQGWSNGSEL